MYIFDWIKGVFVSELFLKGAVIGLLLSFPVGPTVVMCIRNSLGVGSLMGIMTGIGAGLADAIYGVIVGYGAFAFFSLIQSMELYLHFVGAIILCYLGCKATRKNPQNESSFCFASQSYMKVFITTLTLTISSPLTFVGVAALCASFDVEESMVNSFAPWILGLGLFVGSCIWWGVLSFSLSSLKKKIAFSIQRLIYKVLGCLLFMMGLSLFAYSLYLYLL